MYIILLFPKSAHRTFVIKVHCYKTHVTPKSAHHLVKVTKQNKNKTKQNKKYMNKLFLTAQSTVYFKFLYPLGNVV